MHDEEALLLSRTNGRTMSSLFGEIETFATTASRCKRRENRLKAADVFERFRSRWPVDGQRFLNGSSKRRPADPRITYLNASLCAEWRPSEMGNKIVEKRWLAGRFHTFRHDSCSFLKENVLMWPRHIRSDFKC